MASTPLSGTREMQPPPTRFEAWLLARYGRHGLTLADLRSPGHGVLFEDERRAWNAALATAPPLAPRRAQIAALKVTTRNDESEARCAARAGRNAAIDEVLALYDACERSARPESIEELALTIHGLYDHDCTTTDACRTIARALAAHMQPPRGPLSEAEADHLYAAIERGYRAGAERPAPYGRMIAITDAIQLAVLDFFAERRSYDDADPNAVETRAR